MNTATKQIRTIIDAFDAGKTIQARGIEPETKEDYPDWVDVATPSWNFAEFEYRIKPEPTFLWVTFYGDGSFSAFATEKEALVRAQSGRDAGFTTRVQKFVEAI
jgi:hypothetical protein